MHLSVATDARALRRVTTRKAQPQATNPAQDFAARAGSSIIAAHPKEIHRPAADLQSARASVRSGRQERTRGAAPPIAATPPPTKEQGILRRSGQVGSSCHECARGSPATAGRVASSPRSGRQRRGGAAAVVAQRSPRRGVPRRSGFLARPTWSPAGCSCAWHSSPATRHMPSRELPPPRCRRGAPTCLPRRPRRRRYRAPPAAAGSIEEFASRPPRP
mmetsp:Transcript_24754/g.66457  ORF Transcript_24754/g.66457 Transcript_24754/m.66457 type:complete len:218 (-) Transcript_24754:896-1549(-)